jgi:DNA-binding MarR family transcriptional regulator
MLPIYEMPGHLIRRLHQISSALFAEECSGFGLTSVQYAAMAALQANPGVDATRLSALIAFDRSTIGDVLDRLEAKGLVRRCPSATDRRVKLLSLTADGAALLDRVADPVARVQQRLLEPLAPADRAVMVRLLAQLASVHNDTTSAPLRTTESG